jgi:NAD(P)-dependent dehydrogenase (short-subunit alcohol dehydrogenase family)
VTKTSRVAVVTGANRGIGRAIAVALAMGGFAVLATARDPASLQDTVAEIEHAGGTVSTVTCDVQDESSVAAMVETALTWGPVHTVVANAGTAGPTRPMHEISLAEWRDCVATNLDGVFLTFRAFIPSIITAGQGNLIAISSMTGKRPLTNRTPYAAAKMGVIGLVRTLATELGSYGIRVNAICPGAVAGPRIADVIRKQAAARDITEDQALGAFTGSSPLGRLVEPAEVARTCAFLASDDAASITGEDMNVTAGAVMY